MLIRLLTRRPMTVASDMSTGASDALTGARHAGGKHGARRSVARCGYVVPLDPHDCRFLLRGSQLGDTEDYMSPCVSREMLLCEAPDAPLASVLALGKTRQR
jgi:hypothetical protein